MPDADVDPQELLPTDLRARWAVVPKFELYQVFVAAFLIGAGAMASVLGATVGPRYLWYGFPLALVASYVQAKVLSRFSDRLREELNERQTDRDVQRRASARRVR